MFSRCRRLTTAEPNRLIEIRLVAGLGNVEYYGTPTGKKSILGLGSITGLGNP